MNTETYKSNTTHLTIMYRIEPGCLGPDGLEHVEAFCLVSQKFFNQTDKLGIEWHIVPRYDKTLSEFQYSVASKRLDSCQAEKVLSAFNLDLNTVLESFEDKLPELIDQYIAAKKS
ncbi:hypothetical protein [Shewanella gelidii]|uniref:Orphan protein n=1 Tax=Shewanella gelidii TaxID=1642821 RepID=A0A917JX58_9GAMM|nr:hypothetical protein [Shewanella gelidii]MCL1098114.1 hypothetical protein [Shewanella gelidii]GGI90650.1 hypothetical protein GCM10009332_29900 [Shewanella gelidii]